MTRRSPRRSSTVKPSSLTSPPARTTASTERAQADVERVAGELVHEDLVRVADEHREAQPLPEPATRERLPYTPPALNIYRDMGAMLALDPPMPRLDEIPWKESGDSPAR